MRLGDDLMCKGSIHIFLLFVFIKATYTANEYCAVAVSTVSAVKSCPSTDVEYEKASQIKNCSQIQQSCTKPEKFKYHCVINGFRNITLEVCAPTRYIHGYCTEFNVAGGKIQEHLSGLPCKNITPPCEDRYLSTDAYKFEGCYRLIPMDNILPSNPIDNGLKTWQIILIILSILITCSTGLVLFLCLRRRNKNKRHLKRKPTSRRMFDSHPSDEEEEEDIMLLKRDLKGLFPHRSIATSTTTDKYSFAAKCSVEDLSEKNLEETKRYLKSYKVFDEYFVETELYKIAEKNVQNNGVVILTGPPGCGKTNAAVHLMIKLHKKDWVIRKIRSWEEFLFLQVNKNKNSIIFIDNIFYENIFGYELEKWWEELDQLFDKYVKLGKDDAGETSTGVTHLIITARENVIGKACENMKRVTPIFNENNVVTAKTHNLTKSEKYAIFQRQLEYAKEVQSIDFPDVDDVFKKEIEETEGPIGFPLCAHLYACKEEYRQRGTRFFSHPTDFLILQIQDEIGKDKTNKTKSLFLVLFLYEWQRQNSEQTGKPSISVNVGSETEIKTFLSFISYNIHKHFKPLDFKNLLSIAEKLSGVFFREMGDGTFQFTHVSVYEAVGAYLCDKYFDETAQFFPLDIIQNQEYTNFDNHDCQVLALRFIYEILNKNLSKVFACHAFKWKSFTECFCAELGKRDINFIKRFFQVVDDNSKIRLSSIFWTSLNNLSFLTKLLFDIIREKNIDVQYHELLSLYGECCATNKCLLRTIDGKFRSNFEEIKERVLEYKDDDNNNVFHIVVMSERSDSDALNTIRTLKQREGINKRNKEKKTPLMLAVECQTNREKVIEELIKAKANINFKDGNGFNVLHCCVNAKNEDALCARVLETLLRKKVSKKVLNSEDNEGETPLNTAAKYCTYSRILSILRLVNCDGIAIDTINLEGCSLIYNTIKHLEGTDPLIELERFTRVAIFLIFGVDPKTKSDAEKMSSPMELCEEKKYHHLMHIFLNQDQESIANTMETILTAVKTTHKKQDDIKIFDPSNKLNPRMKCTIEAAVSYLANANLTQIKI